MNPAIAILAEVDLVGVGRENLLLAVVILENQGDVRFPQLALESSLARKVEILDKLLGDGAATLCAPLEQGVEKCAQGATRVDPEMAVETPVLDGKQCLLEHRRDLVVAQDDPVLVVTRIDASDLQRLEPDEVDLRTTAALPQGFNPVVTEAYIQ